MSNDIPEGPQIQDGSLRPLLASSSASAAMPAVLDHPKEPLTRQDGVNKACHVQPHAPDIARSLAAAAGVAPLDTKAFFGKGFFKKFSNGLEGFARPPDASPARQESPVTASVAHGSPLSVFKHSNVTPSVLSSASVPANQNQKNQQLHHAHAFVHPKPRHFVPSLPSGNEKELSYLEFKRPLAIRSAYTPSSTPAHDVDPQDLDSHAPVDYAVFQSLMVAQSKKDKLLKAKEEELSETKQRLAGLLADKGSLVAELDRVKKETKAYIQHCDKLVRNARQDAQTYHDSSMAAHQGTLDELKAHLPDLKSIKNELLEQMQDIETQLGHEHDHRVRVGQELLHQLETYIAKHTADFLRDKLISTTSDLADAKSRVQELEEASLKENVALQHALRLLETTRTELSSSRQAAEFAQEDKRLLEEVEEQLKAEANEALKKVAETQELVRRKEEDILAKEREMDRLNVLLTERTSGLSQFKHMAEECMQVRDTLQAKEKELAVLQERYEVALKQLDNMHQRVMEDTTLRQRLEDALCKAAALESQESKHTAAFEKQKDFLSQTESNLKKMEDQYWQTKTRLDKAVKEIESLDNRYEDYKVFTRRTKQDLIDAQEKLTSAQEELKAARINAESRSEEHAQERRALQQLLESNSNALEKLQEELKSVNGEKARLEAKMQNDPEKSQLRSQLARAEIQASEERQRLQAVVSGLEKQMQAAILMNEELRLIIKEQTSRLDDEEQKKEGLVKDRVQALQELTDVRSVHEETLASVEKLRSTNDAISQEHARVIAGLREQLAGAERLLASAQTELDQNRLRIQSLQDQNFELMRNAEGRELEVRQANERWNSVELKMESLVAAFSNTAASIQKTATETAASDMPGEGCGDANTVDETKAQLQSLYEEVAILTERNSELEEMAANIVERYKIGELTDHETNLVKQVVKSAMHVNQKDLVQKANDIKRRDATIQAMEKRVVDLEKQLAARLVRRSPAGQLMTMKDIFNSSPLSQLEDQGAMTMQQMHLKAGSNNDTTTPVRLAASDTKAPVDRPASRISTPNRLEIHEHRTTTFAVLNRATSDDGRDEILQFSDRSPPKEGPEVAPPHAPRQATRSTGKRERQEEGGRGEPTAVLARPTRRRKLSGTMEGPVVPVVGVRKGTNLARNSGKIESASSAGAKHRTTRRGRMCR